MEAETDWRQQEIRGICFYRAMRILGYQKPKQEFRNAFDAWCESASTKRRGEQRLYKIPKKDLGKTLVMRERIKAILLEESIAKDIQEADDFTKVLVDDQVCNTQFSRNDGRWYQGCPWWGFEKLYGYEGVVKFRLAES